jgi:LmbE family N-acetylglucosaminyl deacetylase
MPGLDNIQPARVLAVYAHPDDPEVSCGGTLARWAGGGATVHVLICTRGEKGASDRTIDPGVLAEHRAGEVAAAARVLGAVAHEILPHGDGDIENSSELREQLVTAIRQLRPDVVICPDPTAVFFGSSYFNHRDHRVVGWATLDAVSPAAAMPHYYPSAGPPHQVSRMYLSGTLEPDAWVDITATIETKTDALLCHASQLGEPGEWLRTVVRERAEEGGKVAGVRYAEGFRRLVLADPEP